MILRRVLKLIILINIIARILINIKFSLISRRQSLNFSPIPTINIAGEYLLLLFFFVESPRSFRPQKRLPMP